MNTRTALGGITTAAAATTLIFVGIPAAHAADDCVPTPGAPAALSAWAWSEFTPWQTSTEAPADPDGQAGEDNPANLVQIGEGFADAHSAVYRQVVSASRTTAWQTSDVPPAIGADEQLGQRYEQTVTTRPATPGSPSRWWNWSPNKDQGPQDYVPAFPTDDRGTWQGPHTEGGPDGEGTFNVSNGNSGNSSWFHRDPAVEGTPATTVTEYQWKVTSSRVEYRWSSYTRTLVEATDPVTCSPGEGDGGGEGEQPPSDREGETPPNAGPVDQAPSTAPATSAGTSPATSPATSAEPVGWAPQLHAPHAGNTKGRTTTAVVPTVIDAGL